VKLPEETMPGSAFVEHSPVSLPQAFGEDSGRLTDPNTPAWGVGGAIIVWIGSVALLLLIPVALLLPYAAYRGIAPGNPDYARALSEFVITDKAAIFLQVLAVFPAHLLTILLVWCLVTRFGRRDFWASLAWRWDTGLQLWGSLVLGAVLFGVGSGIAKLLGGDVPTQLEQIINSSKPARYLIALLAVATAPLAEELIYRGVLYSALQRALGVTGAVLLVLALFTIVHVPQYWPNYGVIAAVGLLSISLTVIRAYTNRLFPCVVIHLVFNGIQAVLLLVSPHT